MKKYSIKRIILVIIGSTLLGIGISLAILSGYGGDAISVFSEGLGKTLGITLGMASLVYYGIFCIPVVILDRKQIGIGTILSPVVCAFVIDFVLAHSTIELSSYLSIIVMLIGIVLIGIGLGIYIYGDIGKSSYDACLLMVSQKTKKPIAIIKATGDLILCAIGYLLGGTIGLGPICAILFIGPVLQQTLVILNKDKNN